MLKKNASVNCYNFCRCGRILTISENILRYQLILYFVLFVPLSIYLCGIVLTPGRSGPYAQAWRAPAAPAAAPAAAAAAGVGVGAGVAPAAAVAAAAPDRGSSVGGPGMDLGGRRSDS